MNFLTDDDGFAINTAQITAVRIKANKNDGTFKHKKEYPFVAIVHVAGREKPFAVYLTKSHERELSRFVQNRSGT
jgi:hypothetical protein